MKLMRLCSLYLFFSTFSLLFLLFSSSQALADTTPFRSAGTVTADGSTPYINLGNCTVTDGLTCDHLISPFFANLYFRNFGTYQDFGIPQGSTITHVRIKVTGKSSVSPFVGVSPGPTYNFNCHLPSTLWTLTLLRGSIINVQNFRTPLSPNAINGNVSSFCFEPQDFATNNFIFRINFSSSINWSSNIDNLEIAFDYDPPVVTQKEPVLFIPGIGGSELKVAEDTEWSESDGHGGLYTHTYPKDEIVWINASQAAFLGNDDYFDILRMGPDGMTSQANITTTEKVVSMYDPTIQFFTSQGYTLGTDLFVFPYDWRKDISSTTSLLDQKIEAIKQATGADKVNIVAHSMGGLVSRLYISYSQRAQKVKRLFTLGTPHLGSVKLFKNLLYGDCLTIRDLGPVCVGIPPSESKDVTQNMISGYELAPSQMYYTFYPGTPTYPYPFLDLRDIDHDTVTGALNYDQIKTLLSHLEHNTSLFTPSESLHELDTTLPQTNGVEVVNIAGSGIPTLGQIIEKYAFNAFGIQIPKTDEVLINGDTTVPLFSASLIDPTRNLSLLGNAKIYYTKQNHGELTSSGPALQLVTNILSGNSTIPAGVANQPFKFSGTSLSVHSPVEIHVYDALNRHTGPTSDGFEEGIPGSQYDTLGEAKFIFLPENGVYRIVFDATDQGSFDFKIKKYADDENTETMLYKDVPLLTETVAETIYDTTSSTPPFIHVDEDGNGTEDKEVASFSTSQGEESNDLTAPLLSLTVTPSTIWPPNGKMVSIHITGSIADEYPYQTRIVIDDEYDEVEPSLLLSDVTYLDEALQIKAARRDDDKDGRKYTVRVFSTDIAGNTAFSTFDVVVPHDQKS